MNPIDLITIAFHWILFTDSLRIYWSHSKLCARFPFLECYSLILLMENLWTTEVDFSTVKTGLM